MSDKSVRVCCKMILLLSLLLGSDLLATGQQAPPDSLKADSLRIVSGRVPPPADDLDQQFDIGDLVQVLFSRRRAMGTAHKRSGITIIPNIAANPSIGLQGGIKAVAGLKFGKDPRTLMSVAATSASITTRGILYFYLNHNVFTNANRWNIQGSLVAARMVTPDYGMGIGHPAGHTEKDLVLTNSDRQAYVLRSIYFNFREKIYKELWSDFFVGAGVSFDIRSNIEDRIVPASGLTPNAVYSEKYGFDQGSYMSNGLLLSMQYTTRDNQNRAYKGIYADAGFRINQTWLGSTRPAVQFTTDFRKYISLSQRNPEQVIAFWNWGAYLVNGALPYPELPGTARDPGSRSGRGYTITYFKGTQYNYSEVEYRFPITRNKFISGVTFVHLQTANNELGTKLFQQWQPGGGAGLRILFNKATRTNLCLDYAFGRYGAKGFFLGLNEAF